MTSSRKYPDELRERATRLVLEARRDPERSKGAQHRAAPTTVRPRVTRVTAEHVLYALGVEPSAPTGRRRRS